jgi:hypothetical protein
MARMQRRRSSSRRGSGRGRTSSLAGRSRREASNSRRRLHGRAREAGEAPRRGVITADDFEAKIGEGFLTSEVVASVAGELAVMAEALEEIEAEAAGGVTS